MTADLDAGSGCACACAARGFREGFRALMTTPNKAYASGYGAGVVEERNRIAAHLRAWAESRFASHWSGDARGAAFYDVAYWLTGDEEEE